MQGFYWVLALGFILLAVCKLRPFNVWEEEEESCAPALPTQGCYPSSVFHSNASVHALPRMAQICKIWQLGTFRQSWIREGNLGCFAGSLFWANFLPRLCLSDWGHCLSARRTHEIALVILITFSSHLCSPRRVLAGWLPREASPRERFCI